MGSHALLPGAAQYLLTSINIYFILKYHFIMNKGEIIPSITQQTQPNWMSLRSRGFILCRYFREQRKKNSKAQLDKVSTLEVGTGCTWTFSQITHWSESLALSCELLKIGYDWLFRSQTTVQSTDNHI